MRTCEMVTTVEPHNTGCSKLMSFQIFKTMKSVFNNLLELQNLFSEKTALVLQTIYEVICKSVWLSVFKVLVLATEVRFRFTALSATHMRTSYK